MPRAAPCGRRPTSKRTAGASVVERDPRGQCRRASSTRRRGLRSWLDTALRAYSTDGERLDRASTDGERSWPGEADRRRSAAELDHVRQHPGDRQRDALSHPARRACRALGTRRASARTPRCARATPSPSRNTSSRDRGRVNGARTRSRCSPASAARAAASGARYGAARLLDRRTACRASRGVLVSIGPSGHSTDVRRSSSAEARRGHAVQDASLADHEGDQHRDRRDRQRRPSRARS